jgi:hypothetical protein
MQPGAATPLHADAQRRLTDGRWVANHTPWRTHVAIIYLTTADVDFRGGTLHLPALGLQIAPRRGLLVGFPSGREHLHEVTTVESGHRLSLSIWMTSEPLRAEYWPS